VPPLLIAMLKGEVGVKVTDILSPLFDARPKPLSPKVLEMKPMGIPPAFLTSMNPVTGVTEVWGLRAAITLEGPIIDLGFIGP